MTSMWGSPLRDRWRGGRDPRQARFLTIASLRWVIRHRAWTPWYLVRYARLLRFRLANPHVVLRGMVFLGKRVELHARPGYGRLEIGRWVHIGDGNSIRCHEGSLRIGDKVVFGKDNTVNCYLDIEIGAATHRGRLGVRHRLRPPHRGRPRADQGSGHRQDAGAHRAGLLDRHQGLGAARHAGRARIGARRRTRWRRGHPRRPQSRSALRPGWCATAWPTTRPPRRNVRRWRTSPGRNGGGTGEVAIF